jgi:GT2 family glycosyltransferase
MMSVYDHTHDYIISIIDNNVVNKGFTTAVNEGIRLGKAEYVWLLNSDATVLANCLVKLTDRIKSDAKIGIVGSCQLDPNNQDIIKHGGTTAAYPFGVHAGGMVSMGHCQIPTKQKWVNFASILLRRKMIDEIGLLDEKFFMYYSDSDYCYTARSKGWSIYYEPESRVLHKLNASSKSSTHMESDKKYFESKWLQTEEWKTLDLIL